jgi:hypothetical protein
VMQAVSSPPHRRRSPPELAVPALPEGFNSVNWADETGSAGSGNVPLTNNQQAQMAAELGYTKTSSYSHGQLVFTNGKTYISYDKDSHSGGTWKMATSIDRLSSKSTRMGSYDSNLNWIAE